MNTLAGFAGFAGAIVFLFGVLGVLVSGDAFGPIMIAHFLVGVGLVALWVYALKNRERDLGEPSLLKGRAVRFGTGAVAYTIVLVALLVTVNYFAQRYDIRKDFTENQLYSLSSQSVQTVRNLKHPIKLIGIKTGSGDAQLEERLKLYQAANSKVSVSMLNPEQQPMLVKKYELKPGNRVFIQYGSDEVLQQSRINDVTEEAVTNAILKLARGDAKKIYYVVGHGEPDIADGGEDGLKDFADRVRDEHFAVEPIVLGQKESVPADAAAVILVSPKRSLAAGEREMLVAYAKKGGRLLLMTDPQTTDDVRSIASQFGIAVGKDVIIEPVVKLFQGPQLGVQPMIVNYIDTPITKGLSAQTPTIFTFASSVTAAAGPAPDGGTVMELMRTGDESWAETDFEALNANPPRATFESNDLRGPLSIGALYTRAVDPKDGAPTEGEALFKTETRIVVYGNTAWITNAGITAYANADLILNSINWIVGEEGGVSIRPKESRAPREPLPTSLISKLFVVSFLVPELFLLLGLWIWWRRKSLSR